MSLILGHRSYKGFNTHVSYPGNSPYKNDNVYVGKYCSIATDVIFENHGNHRFDTPSTYPFREAGVNPNSYVSSVFKKPTKVGNDVWIGVHTHILPGLTIGDGAVIGAFSIVTKDVPPYTIVGGNPAKPIRKRFSDDVIQKMLQLKWWDLPDKIVDEHLSTIEDVHEFIAKVEELRSMLLLLQ